MGRLPSTKFSSIFLMESIPYVLVIILVALMVFNKSFFGSGYLNLGDITLPFLPGKALSNTLYMWSTENFGGYTVNVSFLPFYGFVFLLSSLGIPMIITSRLLFVISLFLVGFSSILLGKALFDRKFSYLTCSILSGFLMVSPVMSLLTQSKFLFAFGGMILVLNFLVRGLRYGQHRKYAFLAALSSVIMSMQPHMFALSAILIFLFLVIYLPLKRGRQNVFFVLGTLTMSLLFNIYWVIPEGMIYLTHQGVLLKIYQGIEQVIEPWAFPTDPLFWRLRLFSFSNVFTELPLIVVGQFVIIAFGLSYFATTLLRRKRPRIEYIPFFFMFFVFLSLYQGVQSPLYWFLWNNFGPFKVLRNSTFFVIPISLIFSVLIGFSLEASLQLLDGWRTRLHRIRNILKRFFMFLVPILFVFIIILYGISGPLLYSGTIDQSLDYRSDMNIPKEYFDLPDLLGNSSDSQYRLLVLPKMEVYLNFTWFPHFKTPDPTGSLSPITPVFPYLNDTPILLENLIDEGSKRPRSLFDNDTSVQSIGWKNSAIELGRLNIKYVFLHHDVNGAEQVEGRLMKQLDSSPFFYLKARYDSFSLYSLDDKYVIPKIYAIQKDYTEHQNSQLLKFNGANHFRSENLSSLALQPPFSISLWMHQYRTESSPFGAHILSSSSIQPENVPAFLFYTNNGEAGVSQFLYSTASGYPAHPDQYAYVSSSASGHNSLILDSFNHLVGVVSNSSIAYYINNELVGNVSIFGHPTYEDTPSIYLGWHPDRSDVPNFNGIITNIQFYKSSLSASQVKEIYQNGGGILTNPINDTDLILHIPLNASSNETSNKTSMNGKWFGPVQRTTIHEMCSGDIYSYRNDVCIYLFTPVLNKVPFKSLSPVSFSGTLKPDKYLLILTEQFDSSWELRVGDNVINEHSIGFEFANLWTFDVEKDESFSIRHVANDYNLVSLFISIGSMFLMFGLLFVFRMKFV